MADEDHPLEHLAATEQSLAAPMPAAERLRAFEDEHFGAKAVRIGGRIERGSGSPYQLAKPEIRKYHENLEKLIVSEQALADAHTALMDADNAHNAALAAVENGPDAASDD